MYNPYLPIQHLDRPAKISPGGICEFFYAKKEDVFLWPLQNPLTSTYTNAVILKEGATWYRCQVIDPDRDYTDESKAGEAGPYVEMRLRGFLPDDSPLNSLTVGIMPLHEYVIVLRERNGTQRLIGNEDSGAKFTQSYDSADSDGTRGRSLVFTWKSPFPAGIYLSEVTANGDIINPPWPGGDGPEIDPTVPEWVKAITQNQILNWNEAHSWGDHAAAGYLTQLLGDARYSLISHTHTLDALSNVAITTPLNTQLLRYDVVAAKWVNWTPTFSPGNHTHNFSELLNIPTTVVGYGITDFDVNVDTRLEFWKDVPFGIAGLGANGKLSSAVLPALSTTETYTVTSEAEMLALDAQRGDFAVRTDFDTAHVFILAGEDPAILANWVPVSVGGIQVINGLTGANITLTTSHIGEGSNLYFTPARGIQNQNSAAQAGNFWIDGTGQANVIRGNSRLEASSSWRLNGDSGAFSIEYPSGSRTPFAISSSGSSFFDGSMSLENGNFSMDFGGIGSPRFMTFANFINANQLGTTSNHLLTFDPVVNRIKYLPYTDAFAGKEDVINKATNLTSPDNTKYPTTLAITTTLAGYQPTSANGSAFNPTLTGALVPATFTSNASGHITAFTTRTLTPTDIGAAASTIPLSTVLTNSNQANNNITLGTNGNASAFTFNIIRLVTGTNYNGTFGVGGGGNAYLAASSGAPQRVISLQPTGTTAQYSSDGGSNYYDMWHANNHVPGSAFSPTLSGANVPATFTSNASGHITAFTTRTLTPGDLAAVNGAAPNVTNWNAFNGTTIAAFNYSDANSPTASTFYSGINMPSTAINFGAQVAFRNNAGYFRTLEAGTYGSWLQFADRAWTTTNFAPLSGSANYIQANPATPQSAYARVNNYISVTKDGSNSYLASSLLQNAAQTRGVNFQLTGDANPGLSVWVHDGSAFINRFQLGANGAHTMAGNLDGTGYFQAATELRAPLVNSNSSTGELAAFGGSTTGFRGGQITFYGGTHATLPGIIQFRTGVTGGAVAQPERMRIAANGNVLVAKSTDDGRRFQVDGSASFLNGHILSTDGTITNFLSHGSGVGLIGTGSMHPLTINTAGTEKMRILTNGNVGIGTSTAATKLEVNGTTTTPALYSPAGSSLEIRAASDYIVMSKGGTGTITYVDDNGIGVGGFPGGVHSAKGFFAGNVVSTDAYILDQGSVLGEFFLDGGNAIGLRSTSNHPVRFYTNNTQRIEITAAGNTKIENVTTTAGFGAGLVKITANYAVANTDHTIINISSSGGPQVTLPSASALPGRQIRICDYFAGGSGTEVSWTPAVKFKTSTFTSFVNPTLSAYSTVLLQSDGTDWWIVGF